MNPFNKTTLFLGLLLSPFAVFSQDQMPANTNSYFSNVLFLTLLVIIILLAILISAFSSVFKNIADSDYLISKYKKNDDDASNGKTFTSVILVLLSLNMTAQENVKAIVKDDGRIGGLDQFTFYFMMVILFIELLILGLMFYQFNYLVKTSITTTKPKKKESKLLQSLTGSIALEEEDSILLDHDYDGIKELDNDLPPWWKYGFYLTIAVAIVYLIHFHVLGTGDLQVREYEKDMAKAKLEVDEYMKKSANNVDENTVKLLTDQSDIATGKDVFIANCAACHGKLGEGSVGPNLTDDYWLHGGSIQDIFKSVKYGWVEKGMKSWKEDLSPMQISQITSFIKTLKGTKPVNPKSAQGDLYIEEVALIRDLTLVKTDSVSVLKDSVITKK